jgi:cytochrome c peroxidase
VQDRHKRTRNRRRPTWKGGALAFSLLVTVAVAFSALTGIAWSAGGSRPIDALSTEPVPEPPNLADFVVDRGAAIALGKAFFFDMQAGSDGATACATCHFNAGADSRSKNQVNPKGAPFFDGGANGQLSMASFPTHMLADPNNAASELLSDTKNVVGSQSIVNTKFDHVVPGNAVEVGAPVADKVFSVAGNDVRQVTPRNAPTVINAAFNFREQWDGKAQNVFNGVNVWGDRTPGAKVLDSPTPDQLQPARVEIPNGALASQAVGPMTNAGIMSFAGRGWPDIARKLSSLQPLGEQTVSSTDSVLGPYANPSGKGLNVSYADLIKKAFAPRWWDSTLVVQNPGANQTFVPAPAGQLPANEITQLQANFSLFWGLAVQMYESSLVSDQTPVDQFLAGDKTALTQQEQDGMSVFTGKGQCSTCHAGPELTNAATAAVTQSPITDGTDTGFENIGVRDPSEDVGLGGVDVNNNPLSMAGAPAGAVDGMFKIPGLRNVALTAPYFHNGSAGTLQQVVEFYNRGGNVDAPNRAGEIKPLNLSDTEKADLVAFLQALTDPRVLHQQAPFDHPELLIPNGASGDTASVATSAPGVAADEYLELPAIGAGGATTLIQPFPNNPFLPGFLQALPAGSFQPVTGAVPPAAPAPAGASPAAPATPAAPAPAAPTTDTPSAPAASQPVASTPPAATAHAVKPAVTRTRSIATVTASIKLKRAARLRIRALDSKGKHRLVLLAGSRVGTVVSRHDAYAISARMAHGGKLTLRLRLARAQLVSGRKFRVLVDTMGRRHAIATARLDVVAP